MAAVVREPDENGVLVYKISTGLVHKLIVAIITAVLSIAGYMVVWAVSDSSWRTATVSRLTELEKDVAVIEVQLREGQLPIARQRLDMIEWQVKQLQSSKVESPKK